MISTHSTWSACRHCGLLHDLPPPARGYQRICTRCRTSFGSGAFMPQVALAAAWTFFMLFLVLQLYPLMQMQIEGQIRAASIFTDISTLGDRAFPLLGTLVLLLVIAAPLLRVVSLITVLTSLHRPHQSPFILALFRLSEQLRPWAMLDVLLLGAFVSQSKLEDLAQVQTKIGYAALCLAVVAIFTMEAALDRQALWDMLKAPCFTTTPDATWHSCHLCNWLQAPNGNTECERCGTAMHHRKRHSLSRTWALVIAGFILYIPANLYPVLFTTSFGQTTPSTIMGGVRQLMEANDYLLAIILFTASIVIPLIKLLSFVWLMIGTHYCHRKHLILRTRLYKFVYFIGRWSNTDIFVGATLTGLVALGGMATITPGIGGAAFAAVVVLTMFAAETFDPRLMWDAAEVPHG